MCAFWGRETWGGWQPSTPPVTFRVWLLVNSAEKSLQIRNEMWGRGRQSGSVDTGDPGDRDKTIKGIFLLSHQLNHLLMQTQCSTAWLEVNMWMLYPLQPLGVALNLLFISGNYFHVRAVWSMSVTPQCRDKPRTSTKPFMTKMNNICNLRWLFF